MRILVLGGTGMLGYQVMRTARTRGYDVQAVVRDKKLLLSKFGSDVGTSLHVIKDIKNFDVLQELIRVVAPDYVINCIGIVKQSPLAEDYFESISINSLLPHQLAKIAENTESKLIHISTDCVFDGKRGMYHDYELPNAYDLYGKSKHLGEVTYGNSVTLRTSIIGHEIAFQTHGLVEWFLKQQGEVSGYQKVFFSGLTTVELTNVILDYVIAKNLPGGLYQVAAERISKFDLITLIKKVYNKDITINPTADQFLDRSLDGSQFEHKAGYKSPSWEKLIYDMKKDFDHGL